jgi:hypothetical protein
MIKMIRNWIAIFMVVGIISGASAMVLAPSSVYAADDAAKEENPRCPSRVIGFPTWYRGLTDADCNIKAPEAGSDTLGPFIWKIALNGIEIAMIAVGYIAVGYIIYGGFKYITAAGEPKEIVTGRKLILNAVIGLVISLLAVAIVNIVLGGFS